MREALQRDSKSPEAHFALAKLLPARRSRAAPRERAQRTFGEALVRLAEDADCTRQLDAARTSAQRSPKAALAILANLGSAKLLMADAYAKQKEIDLAVEAYQVAYGLDRTDPAPLIRASAAYLAQGRATTGRAFAVRATQDFPLWSPAWLALGHAAAAQNEIPAARQAYETAVMKARGLSDASEARRRLEKLK